MNYSAAENFTAQPPRQGTTTLAILSGLLCAAIAAGAVVTREPAFVATAGGIIAVAGGLLILRHPSVLLWILVLSAPFDYWLGVNLGGTTVHPYGALAALGLAWIVWQSVARRRSVMAGMAWHFKVLITVTVLLFAEKIVAVYSLTEFPPFMTPAFCLKLIVLAGLQFAAAIVCACFMDTRKLLESTIRVWIHLSNVICFYAFLQLLISNTTHFQFVWHKEIFPLGRPYAVFREPDVLGSFYATDLVLAIPLLVGRVKFINRTYLWLTILAQGFFFLIIVVRAAWIATAVSLALYVLLLAMTGRFRFILPYFNGALALAAVAVVGVLMTAPSVTEKLAARLGSFSNPGAESGAAYRMVELEMMAKVVLHPTLATGGGMANVMGHGDFSWSYWAPYLLGYRFDQSAKRLPYGQVLVIPGFCSVLSIVFDNGVAGLALYAMFFLTVTAGFVKALRRSQDQRMQAVLIATYLPLVALLVCYVFSYDPLFIVFFILLGFHLAAQYHATHETEAPVTERAELLSARIPLTRAMQRELRAGAPHA